MQKYRYFLKVFNYEFLRVVYITLEHTRLNHLFSEFFIGIERKLVNYITNKEISFNPRTKGKQIDITETFKFKITNTNETIVEFLTQNESIE